jgi:DNA-binding transcriptional LysR family regulator
VNFTLKQLQVFVSIAEGGSTLAAARALERSQPSVSQSLGELESRIGVTLFDRWKQRLVLNERGRSVLPMARVLLAHARELEEMLSGEVGRLQGTLRIGASLTVANYFLPEILSSFSLLHPHARLEVACRNRQRILSRIETFSADIGMIAGTSDNPDIRDIPWLQDDLCVFVSQGHPLAKAGAVRPEELMRHNWIMREPGSGTREVFFAALRDCRNQLRIDMEFESSEAIKRAVERGRGVSCLSRMAVARELEQGQLTIVPTPDMKMERDYFLLTHRQRQRSPLLQAFVTFCRQWAAEWRSNLPEAAAPKRGSV